MVYLGNLAAAVCKPLFFLALIVTMGYFLGSISVRGISLGTAGILVVALGFGILFSYFPSFQLGGAQIVLFDDDIKSIYSFISNIGTAIFITAVGLTAGPKFFRLLNRKSISSVLMGPVIICTGALIATCFILFDDNVSPSLGVGLMTGAMTSTPGFSSARDMVSVDADMLAAGYGIAYLFGILGKVLFMQLTPRVLHINKIREMQNYVATNSVEIPEPTVKLVKIDNLNFFPFFFTVALGCILGSIRVPGIDFSLGTSGGTLIAGLVLGHFRHVGRVDFRFSKESTNFYREFGLALFLVGAGVPGGVNFIANVRLIYFVYGACITLIPMITGYLVARYVFKLSFLNAMASIAGGLTSTPALGALISACGTDEVISAYAATYPVALVCIVFAAKILITIL